MDTAAAAAAAQSPRRPAPPRPAEWSRALERAPRQIPHGLIRNTRTALSPVELSPVELSPVELSPVESSRAEKPLGGSSAPEDATREARLGKGLESPLRYTDRGGETACYAHLVCPECGAMLDGSAHAFGCKDSNDRR